MVTVAKDIIYCAVRSQVCDDGRQIHRKSVACRSNFQGEITRNR